MNKEERMETTPQNTKGPDAHTTADRAASAKKTREDAARKLKAAIKEAAKAADTGAGSGSVTRFRRPLSRQFCRLPRLTAASRY
jgi:hypothetical protein